MTGTEVRNVSAGGAIEAAQTILATTGEKRLAAAYWTPITELSKWTKNPRKNDKAVPRVARSIRKWGFVAPVVVWESKKRLVAGHTRIAALESILKEAPGFVPRDAPGTALVPVRFHEFTDETEANAYALADNKLNEIATWDDEGLAQILADIRTSDSLLLEETGFSDAELRNLLGDGGRGGVAMCRFYALQQWVS
jgi:ParB-like chromosome segregation protein Spo0J